MQTMLALLFATFLAGCTTLGKLPAGNGQTMQQFTRADAVAALQINQFYGDKQGAACAHAIIDWLPADASAAPPTQVGVLSTIATVRGLRIQTQQGVPDAVVSACAPAVLNSNAALLNAFNFLRP